VDRAQARYAGDIHLHERRRPHGRDQGDAREATVVLRKERNGNYDNTTKPYRISQKQGVKSRICPEVPAQISSGEHEKKEGHTSSAPGISANGAVRKDGATKQSASAPVFKHPHPKTELKATSQRYVDSEERYRTLFNLSPMAVYSIDASGVIREFNRHAAELWGREPVLGDTDERFCGSFKMFRPDGTFMPHNQCPMAEVVSGKYPQFMTGKCTSSGPTARMSPSLSIFVR